MTRMLAPVAALLLLTSSSALAKSASVVSVTGDVKVGKEGAWKPATPGAAIAETDFLLLADKSTATVTLADGTKGDFQGKVLVPGRRLASTKAAGALLKFSRSLQKAAESVVGTDIIGTVPGATKACDPEDEKLGKCVAHGKNPIPEPTRSVPKVGGLEFMGDDPAPKVALVTANTEAEHAENAYYIARDKFGATQRSEAILSDKNASDFEKRRAALVLANIRADGGEVTKAFKLLETVVARPTTQESSTGYATAASAYRVSGLVLRGQIHMQLGDGKKAEADFIAARDEFNPDDPMKTYPLAAYRASLFLVTLALERDDVNAAKKYADRIKMPGVWKEKDPEPVNYVQLREIKQAADELIKSASM